MNRFTRKSGNCYTCKNYQNCKWIQLFNMNKEVGCVEFNDKDYIKTYTSNTLNNNEEKEYNYDK